MTNTDTFPKSGKKERKKKLTQGGSNEPLNSSQKRGKVREFLRWSRYFEAMFSVSLKGGITLWAYFEPKGQLPLLKCLLIPILGDIFFTDTNRVILG